MTGLKRLSIPALCLLLTFALCACRIIPEQERVEQPDIQPVQQEAQPQAADQSAAETEAAQPEDTSLKFPQVLEGGALTVDSFFTSDITNPDKDDEPVSNLASLQVTNTGDAFLASADLSVTLQDGTQLAFHAADLPAGSSALIFDVGSTPVESTACESITAKLTAKPEAGIPDGLDIAAEDTVITVTNNSATDFTDLTVTYHCLMDDVYFGGISYSQTIDSLPTGESASLTAEECWLGTPEVVCVTAEQSRPTV